MNLSKQTWHYIIIAALAVVVCGLVMCGDNRNDYTPVATSQARFDSSAARFDSLRNVFGQLVVDNRGLQADKIELQALADRYFNMRDKKGTDTKTLTVVKPVVRHDTFFVAYDTGTTGSHTGTIPVPQSFAYIDSTISIEGEIRQTGIAINNISQSIEIAIRTGTRKTGWFGREDFVQAISPNPNVSFTGLASMSYKSKPNNWNKWIKPVGCFVLGAAASYYVTK